MLAGQGEQTFRRGFLSRQAGDKVSDLDAFPSPDPTSPLDADNLRRAGPLQMFDGFACDGDLARLDAAMTFLDALCARKIGRRAVTGGKGRRRRS